MLELQDESQCIHQKSWEAKQSLWNRQRVSLSSKGDLVHLFSVRHIYEYLQYEYLITVSIQESPNLQILHYEFCPIITLVSDSPSDIPPGQSRSPPPRRPRLWSRDHPESTHCSHHVIIQSRRSCFRLAPLEYIWLFFYRYHFLQWYACNVRIK